MLALFLTPPYAPFLFALFLMIGIGLIEAIGLGLGQLDLDADLDADVHGPLDWLGIGAGVPILIWLTSLLGCFSLAGIIIQNAAGTLLGAPLHWGSASIGALVAGGFVNRYAVKGLARIMPGYESSVISTDDLLMRRGTVLEGAARRGHPARAKVVDQHGQAHYIMVEPHYDGDVISHGEIALLIRREGPTFFVLPDNDSVLRPIG